MARDELLVVYRTYELLKWFLGHLAKFPSSHRYGLGQRSSSGGMQYSKVCCWQNMPARMRPLIERARMGGFFDFLVHPADGGVAMEAAKMCVSAKKLCVMVLVILAGWCPPLLADTGYADSPVFVIDNRTGTGFRVTALTSAYAGVFPSGVDIINTMTATVDWAGNTPQSVVFNLDGHAHTVPASGTSAQTTYNMGSDLTYGLGGVVNELTAVAVATDGSQSHPQRLKFWGLQMPEWATSIETSQDIGWRLDALTGKVTFYGEVEVLQGGIEGTVTVPSSIPEVGGKWGVKINPLNFEWELSAQPRYGDGAGLTGSLDVAGTWEAELKAGTQRKGELSATIGGEGELYPQFKLTDLSAELAGSLTFLFPRVPLLCQWTGCCHTGYCPYFQASIKPEVIGTVAMEEGEPELISGLKFKTSTLELGVTVAGTVGAGSEGSIYYIAGTIGGHPSITLQFPGDDTSQCFNEYVESAEFNLEASFVVESGWWQYEQNWTFPLLTCGGGGGGLLDGTPGGDPVIRIIDRSYLQASEGYCVFADLPHPHSPGGMPDPILNVGTAATPSLAADTNSGLLLFVYDNGNPTTGQHQEIYYARWAGGQWTSYAPLTVNTKPDIQPVAAIDAAGTEIAIWATAPQPTGSETGPRAILPGFEIEYSKFNIATNSWEPAQPITGNAHVDMLPWIEKLPGEGLRACWIASSTNSIPVWHDEQIAPLIDVMAADWDGVGFGAPYAVATSLQAVSPPSITRSATQEFLAYTKDVDNNAGTAQDREVVVRVRDVGQSWGTDVLLTNDALSDVAAQVASDGSGMPVVVWVKRLVPVELPDLSLTHEDQVWFSKWTGTAWSTPAIGIKADGIAEPKLSRNDAGKLMLFWVATSKEFSDIYYSVYDAALGLWGSPQQVTADQGAETMLALTESGGNILTAYVKRRIDLTATSGLPQIGLSDIFLTQHIPAKDLFVGVSDLTITPDPAVPGQSANICANVHLSGDFTVEQVAVSFYDGDPSQAGVLIGSTVVALILPGQVQPACVPWTIPNDGQAHQVFVVIDPANIIPETDDTNNNKASRALFAPDLRSNAPAVMAYPGADSILVGCTVRNDGTAIAGASTLEVRRDSAAGPIVFSSGLPPIPAEGSSSIQFNWDVTGLVIGNYTLVFLVDAGNTVVESIEANNTASLLVRVMGDLQAETWSAVYAGTSAQLVVRNIGAKPMGATNVRATQYGQTLGETPLAALAAGDSATVVIALSGPVPAGTLTLIANPTSTGSDEVSLLNNSVSILVAANPDLNCDGVVNMEDIPHFVQALTDPAGYAADHDGSPYSVCNRLLADMNSSGQADGFDIQPFVAKLIGG